MAENWVEKIVEIRGKTNYLQNLEDGVYFDSVNGSAGTTWPTGTAQSPSNTIADVITMCTARKTKIIHVCSALTLGATMQGYTFIGTNIENALALNGQDVDGSIFRDLYVSGAQGGTGGAYYFNCFVYGLTGVDGYMRDCYGSFTPKNGKTVILLNFHTAGPGLALNLTGLASTKVYLYGLTGELTISNSGDGNNAVEVYGNSAKVVSSANTAGTITVYGDTLFTAGGAGATETDNSIYSKVAAVNALVATTVAGKPQTFVGTVDLHNAAGDRLIATGTTQAVIIDSIVFSPQVDVSDDVGGITGISIQDDDTTPHIFIPSASGVKANLTAYAQLAWTGAIKLRVGKKINCTIIGGTADADPTTCNVEITYHAVVAGGTLA
jgi:hypothetical protein